MDLYHVLSMIVIRVKHLVVGHACTRDKLNSTHQNVYFFFNLGTSFNIHITADCKFSI